ncbi:hypothetical protein LWM68_43110 [Niabella sp. W65]|nr:hypothetical protein [Niabella sp. W65]MCH7368931.1 hypothetical protein [Niabella sp. W65]
MRRAKSVLRLYGAASTRLSFRIQIIQSAKKTVTKSPKHLTGLLICSLYNDFSRPVADHVKTVPAHFLSNTLKVNLCYGRLHFYIGIFAQFAWRESTVMKISLKNKLRKIMWVLLSVIVIIIAVVMIFVNQKALAKLLRVNGWSGSKIS